MIDFKRQTFQFSTGKHIKLYGNGFFVSKALQIGEAAIPNLFFLFEEHTGGRPSASVSNPYGLTAEEIQELADYNIRLWFDLKESVRRYGVDNPKVFNRENMKQSESSSSNTSPKRENNKPDNLKETTKGPDKENA